MSNKLNKKTMEASGTLNARHGGVRGPVNCQLNGYGCAYPLFYMGPGSIVTIL